MSMRPPKFPSVLCSAVLDIIIAGASFSPSIRANRYLTSLRKVELEGGGSCQSGQVDTGHLGLNLQHYKCDGLAYYGILHQTKITIRHHFIIKMKEEKKLSYKKRLKILNGSRYLIIGQDLLSGVKSSLLDYQYLKGRI